MKPARSLVIAAALVAAFSFAALAQVEVGVVGAGGFLLEDDTGGVVVGGGVGGGVAAPTATITVPSADPSAVSTTPATVSGTTTGTVSGVTWATACVVGPTACSTGAGTFSCSVTQTQDCAAQETVTVVATGPGGTGSDTTVVLFPAFQLLPGTTTPNDLPDALTINATSMTLVLSCTAQNVSGTNWNCTDASGAVVLAEAGAGGSPTVSTLTPFHAVDGTERTVQTAAAGKRYDAPSSSVADITTEDMVVEWVGSMSTNTAAIIFDKSLASTAGWALVRTSSPSIRVSVRTGSTTTNISNVQPGEAGSTNHAIFFLNRDEASTNGANVYVNGQAGTGVDASARSGSLTNAVVASFGSASGGSSNLSGPTSTLKVWKCAGCMQSGASGPAEHIIIARERAAIALGVAPLLAAGTDGPTTMTRASTAMVDVIDGVTRALYNTGNASTRVCRRGAGGVAVNGYLTEPQTTNICLQSQTLGTTFTLIDVGDNVLANAFAGADLSVTGDNVDGDDTGASEHGLRQAITLTAATYTMSAWAKAGEKTWVGLRDNTVANAVASFDLTACAACNQLNGDCTAAVGTVGAGATNARATPWHVDTTGDGVADVELCRVSITYTGTVAAHDHDLLCAAGDNSFSYTDTGAAADCGWWGVEVEAFPMMTSYQATTTASVTRSADDLRFDATTHYTGSPTTYQTDFLCPSFNAATNSTFSGIGPTATPMSEAQDATNDRPRSVQSTWDITAAAGDVSDGSAHSIRTRAVTNDVEAFYDGTTIGTDVSNTLPSTSSAFIYFGTTGGTGAQPGCLVTNFRIWSRDVPPSEAPRRRPQPPRRRRQWRRRSNA